MPNVHPQDRADIHWPDSGEAAVGRPWALRTTWTTVLDRIADPDRTTF
ncbi:MULTISPECIES: hypothetical protein [unclassified Solwaraspora]|nr:MULTISPECIES: hypothetical protein [unclassified Solwaraspora]WBB96986.1 hypothetical protein O7553_27620 [Solwaraspora sp. WMMA2059]WBC19110.1 hypothetical protein O7543_19750 [Solwaraspora sp. WMMA2080]WJK33476.1 hypothetical protein O7610_22740 [Solwaraspora sp. WMMA2065]